MTNMDKLILTVLAEAEDEARMMNEKFQGLTTRELTERLNNLHPSRIRAILDD